MSCAQSTDIGTTDSPQGRKRLFFALAGLVVVLMGVMVAVAIFLVDPRLRQLSPVLVPVAAGFSLLVLCFLLVGLTAAALTTLDGWRLPGKGMRRAAIARLLLPFAVVLGKAAGLRKEEIQRSFLEVNNALAAASALKSVPAGGQILVLLPHCLQRSGCRIRVTSDIANCKQCGLCDLGQFREMLREYDDVVVSVATGGGVARQIVKRTRPDVIVAVACERDLTHGICDVKGIPVVGVLNWRPNGPCQDTCVDVHRIRGMVDQIRRTGKPAERPPGEPPGS